MGDEIPEHADSHASFSHEASLEPIFKRRENLCNHSVYIHFLKDRNCEICEKDRNHKGPVQEAQSWSRTSSRKFSDLETTNHKVLREGFESRNNHRYEVVLQDFASQSYPCKTKNSQETQKIFKKFLEPNKKFKVIYTDNSLESQFSCVLHSRFLATNDLAWMFAVFSLIPHRTTCILLEVFLPTK